MYCQYCTYINAFCFIIIYALNNLPSEKQVINVPLDHALVYSNCALCTTFCMIRSISAIKNHPPEVFLFQLMVYITQILCMHAATQLHAFCFSSYHFSAHLISIRSSEPTYVAPSTTPCTIIRQSFFIIFGIHSLAGAEPIFFDINGETRC